jgi:hypothetical protein
MTHIEVLKLALEALKKAQRQCHYYNIAPHLAYEDAIKALEEALAKQEQSAQHVGEPVAFKDVHKVWADYMDAHRDDFPDRWAIFHAGWRSAEKYTTPYVPTGRQQLKPLTDEQIDKAMAENKQTLIDAADNYWKMRRAYARIIEAAHGIKE